MFKNKFKPNHNGLIKKNIISEVENDDVYDSMMENGTSDEGDSDMGSDISENKGETSDENESDDGFSDKESDFETMHNHNIKETNCDNANVNIKRKITEDTNKLNNKKPRNDNLQMRNLFKPPTVEEINELKETENNYHSNLFRMQIEEMLKEIRIKNKVKNEINKWLEEFNVFLNGLKSQPQKLDSDNLNWVKKKEFKNSFHKNNTINRKFQFQFLKPSKPASFVGSMMSDTIVDSKLIIDVCVEMPVKTFQKGDYINMIYEEKRSLYMLYLAHKMVDSKQYASELIHYNYYQNNRLKTVLEININGKYENKILFRIFPVPEEGSFKLNRFVPWNSNIRCSLIDENISHEDELFYATPNYNSNVLFDLTMKKNNELIQEIIGKNKNLQEGIILLKVWLKQRFLNQGASSFGNHIITLFIVWLFQHKKINTRMTSYQIARNVWHQLAFSNWNEEEKGITLCVVHETEKNQPTLEQMHQYFDFVFVDCTGFLNICANTSLDIYLRIKYESTRVIELLNDNKINSFQQLFMANLPHYIQYDHIFGFRRSEIIQCLDGDEQKANKLNYAGYWLPHATKIVTKILRKGLNDRILSMTPLEEPSNSWHITNKPNTINKILKIGLILNVDRALDVLDKGPQANETTANEFREFWGDKSELRRFQDGSITEACVWASATEMLKAKRLIVKKIIMHLLKHHFKVFQIEYLANQFDCTYELDRKLFKFKETIPCAEFYTKEVILNFDDLGKKLRALQDLPLDVTGIQGISPVFRYTDPVPILNHARTFTDKNHELFFEAYKINDGVIELGSSGKWPNELAAFRRIKTAFHIKIAESLKQVYKLKTRAGIDGIYVLNNGYLYRIEISHPKEFYLLKKSVTSKGITQYNDTTESIKFEKRFNILPKVTSALHGLHQQFSSYGPTVMISKRWLNAQLIDSYHWPEECTELLIASQFLNHNTLQNPCQPQTGFLRFLHLIANTNWKTEMFFLNFNDEMTVDEITELEQKFSKERELFPPLFIATSFDEKKFGLWWSKDSPSIQILNRVSKLAKYSLELLKPTFTFENRLIITNLFIPSLDGYDVIIKLKPSLVPTCFGRNFYRSDPKIIKNPIPLAGFNPVLIGLQELRDGYSEFALFFYNYYGGNEIFVKWKPNIFEPKEFNISTLNACHPIDVDKVACKPETLIADFKIILNNLYDKIIVN